nr:GFA family protein [Rubellimicrobium rubrum]
MTACHCVQCRKVSGHLPFSLDDPDRRARMEGDLATYRSPGGAVRRFCPHCGSKIAFDGAEGLRSVYIGLFDLLGGHRPDLHIFTAYKGDYYALPAQSRAYPGAGPA